MQVTKRVLQELTCPSCLLVMQAKYTRVIDRCAHRAGEHVMRVNVPAGVGVLRKPKNDSNGYVEADFYTY